MIIPCLIGLIGVDVVVDILFFFTITRKELESAQTTTTKILKN